MPRSKSGSVARVLSFSVELLRANENQTGGAGTAAEEAAMGLGIDVSHWSGKRDWRCLVKLGIDFAFIKATEGATVKDELFAYHRCSTWRPGTASRRHG